MSDPLKTNTSVNREQEQPAPGFFKSPAHRLTRAGMVIGVAAAVLLMMWARAFYGSAEAYRQGEESLRQGRVMQAITYFDRAIHWYAPFNPYIERSAQMLWNLSETAEKSGDYTLAYAALTSLKSGYAAAAGFFTPGREWLKRCEDRMDILSRRGTHEESRTTTRSHVGEVQLQTVPPHPSVFWTVVLEIGLLGWIGWIIWMISCVRRKGRALTTVLKWGAPLLLFYALWIIGMMQA